MSTLRIPHVGQELLVLKDWSFRLFNESRNLNLRDKLGLPLPTASLPNAWWENRNHFWNVICPKGTILIVARIYLKQRGKTPSSMNYGGSYDSLTFRVRTPADTKWKSARFWAKLDDVNTMHTAFQAAEPQAPQE